MEKSRLFGRKRRPPRIAGKKVNAARRTLKWLRDRGWTAEVTEHYVHHVQGKAQQAKFAGGYRRDLFGFVDVLAFRSDPVNIDGEAVCFLAVQTTSRQQISAHLRKYRDVDFKGYKELREWLRTMYAAFVIHGWEPVSVPKKNGKGEKVSWQLTERYLSEAEILEPIF